MYLVLFSTVVNQPELRILLTTHLLPGLWRLCDPWEIHVTSTQKRSISKAALLMDLTHPKNQTDVWIWSQEEKMSWQGPWELSAHWKKSNTGLFTALFSYVYLVSTEFPKSWDGWGPPKNRISCIQMKSTTILKQQLRWLVCLQAARTTGMKPCSEKHTLIHSGFQPWRQGTPRSGSWGSAPTHGMNSSSTKGSHRLLLLSTLSRSNWCFVGFF